MRLVTPRITDVSPSKPPVHFLLETWGNRAVTQHGGPVRSGAAAALRLCTGSHANVRRKLPAAWSSLCASCTFRKGMRSVAPLSALLRRKDTRYM